MDLPDSGGDAQLERAVSALLSAPMDYDRPLWDLTMLTGLQEGRLAIISRLHHTVADGHGALMLTGRLIDADPAGTTSLTEALDQPITARAAARDGDQSGSTPDPADPDVTHSGEPVPAGDRSAAALRVVQAARRGSDLVARALATARTARGRPRRSR